MNRFTLVPALLLALASTALSSAPSVAQSDEKSAAALELPKLVTDFATVEASDDHAMGSEDAAITLIVWASVTCPHCGTWFSEEWPAVKSELIDTGKLRIVFREFPTAPAQMAMTGFLLAECAPFTDHMDVIEYQMENQDAIFKDASEGRGREAYNKIANLAGMEDDEAITACLRNPDMLAHIQTNSDRARAAKVKGVPAFFINGEAYKGASDAESLVDLISEMDEKGLSSLPEGIKPADTHAGHSHD
jgi:protein-disulfide isomerase